MTKPKQYVVFDMETNGLLDSVTKAHCICMMSNNGAAIEYTNYPKTQDIIPEALNMLDKYDCIVGHNIIGYDIPALGKLYGWYPKGRVIDTMLMSYIDWPERKKHTLESWFNTLKTQAIKIQNENWTTLTPQVLERCKEDTKGNKEVFEWMCSKFRNWEALELEQMVAQIHLMQQQYGVYVHMDKVKENIKFCNKELKRLKALILEDAPKKVYQVGATVKSPYLKGTKRHTKRVLDWFDGKPYRVEGPFSKLMIEEMNVDSSKELKDFMLTLGWKPVEYNWKKDSNGNFVKENGKLVPSSPKLTEESYVSLPAGLGQNIANYNTLKHRRNTIVNLKDPHGKGLLANMKKRSDGRVSPEAITCGTPTSRYKHKGSICNIPRPSSRYGRMMREMYGVPEGFLMVGADLKGIEARMLAHYCEPYGKNGAKLIHEVLQGDFHSINRDAWGLPKTDEGRNIAKSVLYALMYGAGPPKLASIAGYDVSEGYRMKQAFYGAWPCIERLITDLESSFSKGNWITGLAGRKIYIREKRKLLNSLLQHGAAEVFKRWMIEIQTDMAPTWREYIHQIIAYHDELQYELEDVFGLVGYFTDYVEDKALVIGKALGVKVPVEADCKTGINWGDTH